MDEFRKIKRLWTEKLNLSSARKEKEFGTFARECWKYYASENHDFLYKDGDALALGQWGLMEGAPRVTVNKSFEMVDVFLPYLHHRNPTRTKTDRRPKIDPALRLMALPPGYLDSLGQELMASGAMLQQQQMAAMQGQMFNPQQFVQQFAIDMMAQKNGQQDASYEIGKQLVESVLNYTPHEFNLVDESRRSLTEALVCGRGVWHTKMIQGPHGSLPGTVHVPVERFLVDPDFLCARDWTWVAFENVMPKYLFAQMVGIEMEKLGSGFDESADKQARIKIEGRSHERYSGNGKTHDLVRYWEIYSRCGVGTDLAGADKDTQGTLRELGANVRLIISDCYDEPLNLREDMLKTDDPAKTAEALGMLKQGLKWPLPYWRDATWPWPFALCDFHHQNDSPWPVSHLRPALPAQRMLNWIWSHVASKIKKTSKDKWLYDRALDEETVRRMVSDLDEEFIACKLKQGQSLRDIAFQMQHAPMNPDTFNVAQFWEVIFEQMTGVNALLSRGEGGKQMRSSYEAQLREKIIQSRPEAMADVYENTQSRIARNEAIALQMLQGQDVAKFFHEPPQPDPMTGQVMLGEMSQLWQQYVYTPDEDRIVAETECRIESGSMRKPNIGEALSGLTEFTQVMLQPLMASYQQTGDPTNMNILLAQLCQKTQMPLMALPDMQQQMAMAAQQAQQQPPPRGQAA